MGNTNTIPPSPRVPFSSVHILPTVMSRINPAKAWCFTLNNYTENELGALVQLFSTLTDKYFYIVGEEVGANGTPHLQGYIEKKTGRFRPLPLFEVKRNNTQCMHFEKAKGNRSQNYAYCSKDNKFVTNIPKPVMTYRQAKNIWKETQGISNDQYSPADVNEAAMHIIFAEDLPTMSDADSKQFITEYNEMMADRYPSV